jgi:hypothetical protein
MPALEPSPFDTCSCGDYRRNHPADGPCNLNGLGHGVPGFNCPRFKLDIAEADLTGDDAAHAARMRAEMEMRNA